MDPDARVNRISTVMCVLEEPIAGNLINTFRRHVLNM